MSIQLRQHEVNQKYNEYIQPINQDTFSVLHGRITKIMPDWNNKKILDFGCNIGNLYLTARGKINSSNYVGVDVLKKSIDIAKEKFPETNWIHYNKHNATFNPTGLDDPWFDLPFAPDVIIVYGVFTHMAFNEIEFYINKLKKLLNDGGIIVFSVWEDVYYYSYLGFLDRVFGIVLQTGKPACDKSLYLINRNEIIVDQEELPLAHYDWIESFYKRDFLMSRIPGARPLSDNTWSAHEVYVIQK